jgi:cytochrome P450
LELTTRHPVEISYPSPRAGLLGQLPELRRDPLSLLSHCARDYGDFVRIRLGLARVVLVSHPDLVEEVLVTRSQDFRKNLGTRRLRSALGSGLLVSEGATWLRQRRLMQPAFHRRRVEKMAESMIATVSQAIATWRAGETRDVYADMVELTLKVAALTLFGIDITEDLDTIRRSSRIMTAHLRSRLFSLMMLVPDEVPTPGNLRYAAAIRELDRLIYRVISQRRAASSSADCADLLGMLLDARDDAGRSMTDRQLRDEVFTIMSASYDTTALALTWAWVLLSRNPGARQRLYDEIDSVLDGRTVSAMDLPRLKYVEQVVSETLRLYPSAWVIGREATRDTQLGGQLVRKGTTVLCSPWVLHRDPRFFDRPEVFLPERWADALTQRLHRFAYIPFGAGQRVCIGSAFAQLEATLALATIAQRFRLDPAEPAQSIEAMPVLTLQPAGSVSMKLAAA